MATNRKTNEMVHVYYFLKSSIWIGDNKIVRPCLAFRTDVMCCRFVFFLLSNVDYLYHAICYASFSTKLCVICTKRVIAMVKNGTDFVHPIWFNTFHLKSAKLRAHMKYVCILNNILTMFRKKFQAPLNLVSTATNRKNLIIKYKYE